MLKLSEIRDILLNPTKDGLTKVLSITSLSNFDRVRGQFQKLKSEGYKLTLDVADLVDKRTKELFNGKTKSSFLIEEINIENQNQKRVDELERQLAEMKELLAQLSKMKTENSTSNNSSDHDTSNPKEPEKLNEPTKKKPGRPKNTATE